MEAVKIGKIKVNAKGNVEMTRKELREFMDAKNRETMMVTLLSAIAWLMEEPEFKGDKDRLFSIFKNVQRIILTTLDPNDPFDKKALAKVVYENTGLEVRFLE